MGEQRLEYDASNSWSGYNYQGKTAIFIALKKINALYESGEQAKISQYYMELEWLEDFSILYESGGQKYYESIHQVKARTDTQMAAYAQALTQLLRKIEVYPTIEHAYLHTINSIDYPTGQWRESVREVITTGTALQTTIGYIDRYLDNPSQFVELVKTIHQPRRPTSFITALKNEFDKSFPKERITNENIKAALTLYKTSLQDDLEHFRNGPSQSALDKTHIYTYPNQPLPKEHCPLDKVDGLIKIEIQNYWERIPAFSWKIKDCNLLDCIFLYLLGEIDQHIMMRHKNYRSCLDRLIPLTLIESVLKSDDPVDRCEDYYLYVAKYRILNHCEDYHSRCLDQHQGDPAICDFCQLCSIFARIEGFSFAQLKEWIFVTNPDIRSKIDINSLDQYCQSIRYNNPFFKGLTEIKRPFQDIRLPISFSAENKKLYLLTTLRDDDAPQPKLTICRNILMNSELPTIFMDYDVLLSKDLISDSIFDDAGDFLESFKMDKNNIYHFKQVQMKTLQDSITVLNDL